MPNETSKPIPVSTIATRSEYRRDALPIITGYVPAPRRRSTRLESGDSSNLGSLSSIPEESALVFSDNKTRDVEARSLEWWTENEDDETDISVLRIGNNRVTTESTSTQFSVAVTMDPPTTHKNNLADSTEIFEDDFANVNVQNLAAETLAKKIRDADTLKTQFRTSMFYLKNNEPVYYQGIKEATEATKTKILEFIKKAEERYGELKNPTQAGQDEVSDANRGNGSVSANGTATPLQRFQKERVKNHYGGLLEKLEIFKADLMLLGDKQIDNDVEYYAYDEECQHKVKITEDLIKEAKVLMGEALAVDMEKEAVELDKGMTTVRKSLDKIEKKIFDLKTSLGLLGTSRTDKHLTLELPKFSGKSGSIDFFTFKKRFNEYTSLIRMSAAKQLHVLKVDCINDETLRLSLSRYESVADILEFLEKHYGDTESLLWSRKDDILKSGRFPWYERGKGNPNPSKQRDWLLSMESKLRELKDLAHLHDIEPSLYYSDLIYRVENLFPEGVKDEYMDALSRKPTKPGGKDMYLEFLGFLGVLINRYTIKANHFSAANHGDVREKIDKPAAAGKNSGGDKTAAVRNGDGEKPPVIGGSVHTMSGDNSKNEKKKGNNSFPPKSGKNNSERKNVGSHPPKSKPCPTECGSEHTHLFYCEKFQKLKDFKKRFNLSSQHKICMRCLRMDSDVDFQNRDVWWNNHEQNCLTDFYCSSGYCKNRKKQSQTHMLVCCYHYKDNKGREEEFKKGLDSNQLNPSSAFFTLLCHASRSDEMHNSKLVQDAIPDVNDSSIFLVHEITVENKPLLVLYDTGADEGAISARAYKYLDCMNVKPGPTVLSVAGGGLVSCEGGDERFALDLDSGERATFTALKMDSITTTFPKWDVSEVWPDVKKYQAEHCPEISLPEAPTTIGGKPVDVLLGIKYLRYYPELLFSLPCGLGVYKSKLKCSGGFQAVLGGPHKAWKNAYDKSTPIASMMFYLSKEAKAFRVQTQSLSNVLCFDRKQDDDGMDDLLAELEPEDDHECPPACLDVDCITTTMQRSRIMSIKTDEAKMKKIDDIGTEISYRCIKCRGCKECLRGETIEKTSLTEEVEQNDIEAGIRHDVASSRLYTTLPFIKDPEQNLHPNKHIAYKIFESQKKLCKNNPEMKADLCKSHEKLASNGFIRKLSSLSADVLSKMNSIPGCPYCIPWRSVYKANSISTPLRIVYDASSRTPNGESLNSCLAVGRNVLSNLYQILLRFRAKKVGMTCDVKLAYNGIFLEEEYYKYQHFLWQDDLEDDNPVEEWVIITLIYGVRPSGTITIVGFRILSNYVKDNYPEHSKGAKKLEKDSYMDDIVTGDDTVEDCEKIADDIKFTLGKGSMNVKAFSYSGKPPPEEVSADGKSIGVLGYAWFTQEDEVKLETRDVYLDKIKRGKLPEPIKGDYKDALKLTFTKRTLLRVCATVYDPLGIYTPVMATLKLDLHHIMTLQTDWDDDLPPSFLDTWAGNLKVVENLRNVRFRRAVIPVDAVSTVPELLVSCDASEKIAICVVHARYKLRNGGYSCQILTAKSKLVDTSTIPRAELKGARMAAAMGFICKENLDVTSIKYLTDSTIVLHWLNKDERPLHTMVRNAVIEIQRLSNKEDWFHIEGTKNIADHGTRGAAVNEIGLDSAWQNGADWMILPESEFPIKPFDQIRLSQDEKSQAGEEVKGVKVSDIQHQHTVVYKTYLTTVQNVQPIHDNKIAERHEFSKYVPNPSRMNWTSLVKCRAAIIKYVRNLRKSARKEIVERGKPDPKLVKFTEEELVEASKYFWLKATKEVEKFSSEKSYKNHSVNIDGVLHYSGRILEGQLVEDVEGLYSDLEPLSFVKPILDRHSPLSYSIMLHAHEDLLHHRGAQATLNASRWIAYILNGKSLADEIVKKCPACIRSRAETLEVQMGKIHSNRLAIAPSFFYCQADIFGPLRATCEHSHRSTVKVYGLVFKCTSTGAIACYCMQSYSTESFLSAFIRFSSRYGYPKKITIDEGAQIVKACKEMQIELFDILKPLSTKFSTSIEFETAPVGHHAATGMAERGIKEVRELFTTMFDGLKLDILQYETGFLQTSNELNNLPTFLGAGTKDYDQIDLITPNRLILGRNNSRSPIGSATLEKPKRLLKQMEQVKKAWWDVWKSEMLSEFIPGNSKWTKTGRQPKVGDICIFLKKGSESAIGSNVWKIGRVVEVEVSKDGLIRNVIMEYKNHNEKTFRTTRRSVRTIAILYTEDELSVRETLTKSCED